MWPFDGIREFVSNVNKLANLVIGEGSNSITRVRSYRLGDQPKQLKVRPGQYDDNITLNLIKLVANRTVSQMFGGGIEFTTDEGGDAQKEYLDAVWDANHQEILLHRCELAALEAGTGYLMIQDPAQGMGGMVGEDQVTYPRLMLVEPAFVTMDTLPEDWEIVTRYTIQYKFVNELGKEAARKRVIEQVPDSGNWVMVDYLLDATTGGRWREVSRFDWAFPFPPIIHWQNLPSVGSPYGDPDITDDEIEAQDKINGNVSFLNKGLRLGIHPMRWGRDLLNNQVLDIGPDKILSLGLNGEVGQLPPELDWPGSIAFLKLLRASYFDITRTVDIDSLQDKLGTITNFALRVIYQDNVNKIETKRELMGDALEEINRRLLILAGMQPIHTDVIWPEFVPQNDAEIVTAEQSKLNMGVESKQTAAENLGIDWEEEQSRMEDEQASADNVGAALLRAFNNGGGRRIPPNATNNEEQQL